MEISNERLMEICQCLIYRMYETSECSDDEFRRELVVQIGISNEELEAIQNFIAGSTKNKSKDPEE